MTSPADLARRLRPRPFRPLAIVHGIHAEQLGSQVFLALSVAVEAGEGIWTRTVSRRMTSPETIVSGPRPVSAGSREELLRPVAGLLEELGSCLTGLGLLCGELDVRFTAIFGMGYGHLRTRHGTVSPTRYHRLRGAAEEALVEECGALRRACHEAALREGCYFAAVHLAGWRRSTRLVAPVLAAGREPLVLASDASRSRSTGATTCAWVSEEGRTASFPAPSRVRCIRDGEHHALVTAIRENVAAHPGRRLVVLCDSRPALRMLRVEGTGDEDLDRLLSEGTVTVRWVRGHSGHLLNEIADRLARGLRRSHEFGLAGDETARIRTGILEDLWAGLFHRDVPPDYALAA